MKILPSLVLDLDYRLRILGVCKRNTALVLGYVPQTGFGNSPEYGNAEREINSLVSDLIKSVINTFIFIRWSTFEEQFLSALRHIDGNAFRYRSILLCKRDNLYIEKEPDGFFDTIEYIDDYYLEPDEFLERLLFVCGTVVSYNKEDIRLLAEVEKMARNSRKKVISIK